MNTATAILRNYLDPNLARAFVAGLAITMGFFWAMHLMIATGKGEFAKGDKQQAADFIRLKRNTELETRERKKPPKPPPPKQPPPPQMKVAAVQPTPNAPVPFTMPKLSLSGVSGGPFMGDVVSGGPIAGDSDLIPLVAIQPQYPRQALRDGIEGEVVLELTVAADGTVKNARVVSAKPRGIFESAAIAAAYKARFRPKMVDGKPVEQKGVRPFKFSLDKQ